MTQARAGSVFVIASFVAASLAVALPAIAQRTAPARDPGTRPVPRSSIVPFYGAIEGAAVTVPAFTMDRHPVTNDEFLGFVRDHPEWRRSRVARLFADTDYLAHWASDLSLGPALRGRQPVVRVSWFAARAYCAARGARLPTELEWEVAARADATRADAHRDPAFVSAILEWYSRPSRTLEDVERRPPNVFGLYDLHGLVWEWVEDFNASMVSADDRSRDDAQAERVCGAAAFGATDPADYATFMRFAFRSSLRASYDLQNLGFRCVRDQETRP